jgi:anti-anti-sigma factor
MLQEDRATNQASVIAVGDKEGVPLVTVTGEVDIANSEELREALLAQLGASAGGTLVDLSGVSFIDSSGLRALVTARTHYNEISADLWLVVGDRHVLGVLEISGLDKVFRVFPTVNDAAEAHRSSLAG